MNESPQRRINKRYEKYRKIAIFFIGLPALFIAIPILFAASIIEKSTDKLDAYLYKLAYKNTMKEEYRYGRKTRHK